MPLAKVGDRVPLLIVKLLKVASVEAALVTVIVYVFVVEPSWAVTIVVIVFEPTFSEIALEALPLVTAVPLTLTVAFA